MTHIVEIIDDGYDRTNDALLEYNSDLKLQINDKVEIGGWAFSDYVNSNSDVEKRIALELNNSEPDKDDYSSDRIRRHMFFIKDILYSLDLECGMYAKLFLTRHRPE